MAMRDWRQGGPGGVAMTRVKTWGSGLGVG
jgi:hypothetical protein